MRRRLFGLILHPIPLRLLHGALPAAALLLSLLLAPGLAAAAEVLQVRGPTLLQIGDHNRSVPVQLACVQVEDADAEAAMAWLRQEVPRRTRVNLRPVGSHDGVLVARVDKLGNAASLGSGLVDAGLATPLPVPLCQ
jgi:endonuclease YncB( thermonuclease family)